MQEALTLLEETNPYGNLSATVEDDGRTVYLYLCSPESSQLPRAVWIANRVPAPMQDDRACTRFGIAPLMPRSATRHPDGFPAFLKDDLSMLWFEEGNGVALFWHGDPLAVLPPWSGDRDDFSGYSAQAIGEHPLAWELSSGAMGMLEPRIQQSRRHWITRAQPATSTSQALQTLDHLEKRLGPHYRFWKTGDRSFPALGIAAFRPNTSSDICVFSTVGMSAQSLPRVELCHKEPQKFRRVELAMATHGDQKWAPRLLQNLAEYPWDKYTWLGNGHTVMMDDGEPARSDPLIVFLLSHPPAQIQGSLLNPILNPAPDLTGLVDLSGDPVNYLWIIPVISSEREAARQSGPYALVQKIAREGRGWVWAKDQTLI